MNLIIKARKRRVCGASSRLPEREKDFGGREVRRGRVCRQRIDNVLRDSEISESCNVDDRGRIEAGMHCASFDPGNAEGGV
jgi:hypothetical protein